MTDMQDSIAKVSKAIVKRETDSPQEKTSPVTLAGVLIGIGFLTFVLFNPIAINFASTLPH